MTFSKLGSNPNCGTTSREFIIFERNFIRLFSSMHKEYESVDAIYITILNFVEVDRAGIVFIYDEGTRARKCRKSREASLHPATI